METPRFGTPLRGYVDFYFLGSVGFAYGYSR